MLYRLVRPSLFRLDAETAHHLVLDLLEASSQVPLWTSWLRRHTLPTDPRLRQELFGQTFQSPVGLAAGLDKNGVALPALGALGFGFLEVGTVTPLAQAGNPSPRLFRLPQDEALINRMGFNNAGAQALAQRLERLVRPPAPLWINIGKNKQTPNEAALSDYLKCVQGLGAYADAFVINVSSPNTPGLRALQAADELTALVRAVVDEVDAQRVSKLRHPPVLVKLAPDLHPADFEASVSAVQSAGAAGLIISNTTLSREGLRSPEQRQSGGLSGKPLTQRSTALIREAYRLTAGGLPIVGVGGVFTPEDAYAKLRAGASLVEVYTALIYEGPGLIARLNKGLARLLARDGVKTLREVVGVEG